MAIIQARHSRRLNTFKMEIKQTRSSFALDEEDSLMGDVSNNRNAPGPTEGSAEDENNLEQPWHFWKWIIPVYISLLCVSVVLTMSYFITVINTSEFLLYIGDENETVWILLPTMPTVLMMVEYPFNMIPMDWPMLIFVELLFLFYILVNFVVVTCKSDHENIYEAFDWYGDPTRAILDVFICMVVLAIVFAFFWAVTQKLKLPRYANR